MFIKIHNVDLQFEESALRIICFYNNSISESRLFFIATIPIINIFLVGFNYMYNKYTIYSIQNNISF